MFILLVGLIFNYIYISIFLVLQSIYVYSFTSNMPFGQKYSTEWTEKTLQT